MTLERLLNDEVYIVSPGGERCGPVKASVQRNKVYIFDESIVIEEGGKILRPLPSGKCESHTILQVDFHKAKARRGMKASHYEITTRKDSSLVDASSKTTIQISHSQGIQIGDGNVQNIVASLEQLIRAIDSADADNFKKDEAKNALKNFLKHPLVASVLGGAAGGVLSLL